MTTRELGARLPAVKASAPTISSAAPANVIRLPVATASGRAAPMSFVAAASAKTAPITEAPLRERVGQLVQEGEAVLRPAGKPDLRQLVRTFTLRTSDGFAENFAAGLIARVAAEAPGVRLRFVAKPDKDSASLREGIVDLETGVVGRAMGPEVRTQALFRDRFVGVVRPGHPLTKGRITPARYAGSGHIGISRRDIDRGPVDEALVPLGLERKIVAIVAGFATALALVRNSDLVASVPARHTENLCAGLHVFALPFPAPEITISLLWHPRMEADPAHRWLRGIVREVCAAVR